MRFRLIYQPRYMSPERLMELYHYAWDTFYRDQPQTHRMYKLLQKVVSKEMADGTHVPRRSDLARTRFGRPVDDPKVG